MHRQVDIGALNLDSERSALLAEIFTLSDQIHDHSLSLAGPLADPPDLTMQQVRVLTTLIKEPGLSGHDLGARLGVSSPTASGLIDRLVEKGLVRRSDDPADRRVRRLHATSDGVALIKQMDSLLERAMGKVIEVMSAPELRLMRDSAALLLAAMKRVVSAD